MGFMMGIRKYGVEVNNPNTERWKKHAFIPFAYKIKKKHDIKT